MRPARTRTCRSPTCLPPSSKRRPAPPSAWLWGSRVIERAERELAVFATLRTKASSDSEGKNGASTFVVNRKSDLAAAQWGMQAFHIYGHEGDVSISTHLAAAAAFLKGEAKPGDLPRTNYVWFSMLEDLSLRPWQTFWRVAAAKMNQKGDADLPWLEFLKHWHDLGLAELPGQFDILEGCPKARRRITGADTM